MKWLNRAIFYWKHGININPRLILTNSTDPDSKEPYIARKIGQNIREGGFLKSKKTFLILAILLLPISVYAGAMGDFLSNIFKGADDQNLLSNKNVQNMPLLVAVAKVPDSNQSYEPMVDGNALVPDSGPLGTAPQTASHKPTSDQISIYVVREGDTLSQIAEMFNVTVNTIKWGNDLSSNTLKVGDTLVILPISGVRHTVVKGDTANTLAKKYHADIEEILAYNNIKANESLTIGSVVIIPDGEVAAPTPSPSSSTSKPSGSSNLKEYSGYYMRPVAGGRKTQGIHGYNAVDIAAPVGTPIFAAADGEVIIARSGGWNGGYGNYIVVKHKNGTQTLYAHNSKNNVSVGDQVSQGDVIASMGATGKATGPHIHFEIRGAKNPF